MRHTVFSRCKIVRVACGSFHSIAISEGGDAYSWGLGTCGQLGYRSAPETKEKRHSLPRKIETKHLSSGQVAIVRAACGARHTVLVSATGEAFSFGEARFGQLGLGKLPEENRYFPGNVSEILDEALNVVDVSCGEAHTLFLTTGGQVYSCGMVSDGRLGQGGSKQELCLVPRRVVFAGNVMIVGIFSGGASNAALSDTGCLFSWGRNSSGQLGHGDTQNRCRPQSITSFVSDQIRLRSAAVGDSHMMAVSKNGNVYSWGMISKGRLGSIELSRGRDEFTPSIGKDRANSDGAQNQTRPYLLDCFAVMRRRATHVFAAGAHSLSASMTAVRSKPGACVAICARETSLSGPGLGSRSPGLADEQNILLFPQNEEWHSSFVTMQARDSKGKPRSVSV